MASKKQIAIVGGGPSGLMAAEILAQAGMQVDLYDRMPTLGRKFLMAGRGGLNLTHSEPLPDFLKRYGEAAEWLAPYIKAYTPDQLRAWCEGLGQETFVGSSGRVFPKAMKAAPLLRAWLRRLDQLGVKHHPQHHWVGWDDGKLKFAIKDKTITAQPHAVLFALGGASWPKLGSDGEWINILHEDGIDIAPLRPSNCGFMVNWSLVFREKFAGTPLKSVMLIHESHRQSGEVMITDAGIEGGAVYGVSASLREAIKNHGRARLLIDTRPSMSIDALTKKLEVPRANQSLSNYLRKAGFAPIAINLLREIMNADELNNAAPSTLAKTLKALPITITGHTGLERAISTAGGITREAVDGHFMLKGMPGVFVAGEMLDWEAPTGGYLLQGCFSTAVAAARGILEFCK